MSHDTRSSPSPPQTLIGNANFVLLWCAYGISAVGDHLSEMAILKTQNALDAKVDITAQDARMTFMFFLPFLLLAPLTGLLADRLPRRVLMVSADLVRCVIVFFLAAMIAGTSHWGSWGPFVPLAFVGALAAVFSPARSALLPTLIRPDQLVRANGMISGLGIIATMGAAVLSGYLADTYEDPQVAFTADSATFALSAVLLLMLRPPRQPQASRSSGHHPLGDLAAGFRYARSHRYVWELLIVASLVWFCGALLKSAIPAIVRDVYGGTFLQISGFRAYLGIGFISGAAIVTLLGDALRETITITWGFFGIAVGVGTFAASVYLPWDPGSLYVVGAVGVVTAGLFGVAVMASFNSLLQRTVADGYRGRIFGVKDLFCTAALLAATGMLGMPQWTRVDRWVGLILIAVAAVMAGAGYVTLRIRLKRGPHGAALNFLENLNEFVCKFWWRFRRAGRAGVPHEGAVIVTANHVSSVDPLLLSAATPYRLISFMIAAEYAEWPIIRAVVRVAKCIPVKRETRQTSAIKQALQYLQEGRAVGIFIEGGIAPRGESYRPKDGVAMLALRTGARVIPAHISGMNDHAGVVADLFTRHHARVRFGLPVGLNEFAESGGNREMVRAATQKIYAAIQALAPDGSTNPTAAAPPSEPPTSEST